MSMTQVAFLRKVDLPTKGQIQQAIQNLGYDFKILGNDEQLIDQNGLECIINGHQTFFESYIDDAKNLLNKDTNWIEKKIEYQDTAVSFIWGADFAAGASIGLVSIALIDLSDALIFYIDDQMEYTREMLIADIPQFIQELNKQAKKDVNFQEVRTSNQLDSQIKTTFWDRLKLIFK